MLFVQYVSSYLHLWPCLGFLLFLKMKRVRSDRATAEIHKVISCLILINFYLAPISILVDVCFIVISFKLQFAWWWFKRTSAMQAIGMAIISVLCFSARALVAFSSQVSICSFLSRQLCSIPLALLLDLAFWKLAWTNLYCCQYMPHQLLRTAVIIILTV